MRIWLAGLKPEPWREQIARLDAETEMAIASDEDGWIDEWLMEEDSEAGRRSVSRVQTPMPRFQRHEANRKMASGNSWDDDFKAMQGHVANVLGKLGNGRG